GARARRRNGEHGGEREVVGDARRTGVAAVPPGDTDAAEQAGGDVVGVAFEADGVREELGRGGGPARDGAAGDEAERDRRRTRAEAAPERDPVDEAEAIAVDRREQREGSEREVARVARQLRGALA